VIIGKAKKPRAFGKKTGAQLGFYYRNNAKAWMTSSLYQEWLQQWDDELEAKGRKILLLQDNFSGHIVPDGLRNIHVENLEPNLTAHVQPMDQGIIRCFKAHYRTKYIQRAIDRYDSGITPSEIYNIDQLQAMRLADAAWREVDTTTIRRCWNKAAILPAVDRSTPIQPAVPILLLLNANNAADQECPIANAEKQVKIALDDLVSTGALQASNRMSIEALLNPEGESQAMEETTDEEICQAVLDAHKAQEESLIAGGDDNDDTAETCPTRQEVLQAVWVINRYIDSLNDPVSRKLDTTLASFRRQMRLEASHSMVPTCLTDYFDRNG
jgi:DDE superfamily endonuclease